MQIRHFNVVKAVKGKVSDSEDKLRLTMAQGILRYTGPKEVPDVPEVSFPEYVLSEATKFGKAVAFIESETKEETTFLDVVDKSRRLAAGLQCTLGLSKGDYVAIALHNCVEHTISVMAVTLCGAVASFVNPVYKARELDHVIEIIQPVLWICGPEFLPRLQGWKNGNNKGRIVVLGLAEGYPSWNDIARQGDWNDFQPPEIKAWEDVATMPFSSGTTGLPF